MKSAGALAAGAAAIEPSTLARTAAPSITVAATTIPAAAVAPVPAASSVVPVVAPVVDVAIIDPQPFASPPATLAPAATPVVVVTAVEPAPAPVADVATTKVAEPAPAASNPAPAAEPVVVVTAVEQPSGNPASAAPSPAEPQPAPVVASAADPAATADPEAPSVCELTARDDPDASTYVLASASATDMPAMGGARPRSGPPLAQRTLLAMLTPVDPDQPYVKPIVRLPEVVTECLVAEICIDDYLFALYERTPKVDTNKIVERIKVQVKKGKKTRTVTKSITKLVDADFTWKDPIAAKRFNMSLKEYVIGGMDRSFKQKLHHALRQMDEAGYMPGITSAFRDDYRQAIASGHKASSDSSYHGGSRRGGYGHGMAIDLVSVRGDTRGQRYRSTEELWKWVDAHERELKVGRPYLSRDPPHVGPIDGKEFVAKRGRGSAKAVAEAKQTKQKAAQAKQQAKRKATLAGRHKSAPSAKHVSKLKVASAKAQAKVASSREQAKPKAAAKQEAKPKAATRPEAKPKVTAPARQAKPKVAATAKQDARPNVAVQAKQQPRSKAIPQAKQKVAVQPKKQAGSVVPDRHRVSSL